MYSNCPNAFAVYGSKMKTGFQASKQNIKNIVLLTDWTTAWLGKN